MTTGDAFDKTMAQAIEALRVYQFASAVTLLTQLLTQLLTPAQQALAHAYLTEAYEQQSRWSDATKLLRQYEPLEVRATFPRATQHLLAMRFAALRTEQGDYKAAQHWAKQALHLAETLDDRVGQGAAEQALGKAYRLLGEKSFAHTHYDRALQLHRALGDRRRMADSCFRLGALAGEKSDYSGARHYLERAFPLLETAPDPLLYGHLCGTMASIQVLEDVAPLTERLHWFQQAHDAYAQIGQQKFLARTLNNWGDQLLAVGRWQEAQALFHRALALGDDARDRQTTACVLESLGVMHALQGQYEVGHGYLADALAWVEGYDPFVEAQVLLATARVLHWQGQSDVARLTLQKVVSLAARTEAVAQGAAARLHLAELALEQGQGRNGEVLRAELRGEAESWKSLSLIGQLRLVEGRAATQQQQWLHARTQLEQALSIFTVTERQYWLGRVCSELAQVYEQQGDRARARQTMQRAQKHFQGLAAHPFVRRTEQWFEHHPAPAPTTRSCSAKSSPPPEAESDALLRLLTAPPVREVLLAEFVHLVRQEAPQSALALYEVPTSGNKRLLLAAPEKARLSRGKATQTFPLNPRQGPALCLSLAPAPASLANLRRLLKATEVSLELSALRAKETRYADYERQDERTEIPLPGMLYQSRVMRQLALQLHQVQTRTAAVLITGESGTGKELVARALHALSPRKQHPFIAVNCASTSKELLDDQLFGHKRGAFTGASEAYAGWIRAAEGGTLFLDEVAELSRRAQPKLLRFLQEGEIQPLGEPHPLQTDVRVVAATNADLEALIRAGKFREDLFFRLNIIHLHVPPLRDRREEIVPLAHHFLMQASSGNPPYEFAPPTLDALTTYHWPGNVRQLKNEMERVCARLSPGALISPDDLSAEVRLPTVPPVNGTNLQSQMDSFERTLIAQCLARHPHNIKQAAAELGLKRRTFYEKLRRHGLARPSEA